MNVSEVVYGLELVLALIGLGTIAGAGIRWLVDAPPRHEAPPAPDPGPLVLELDTVWPNGATGAILARLELYEGEEHDLVVVPSGARGVRVRLVHRAGLYAGATTAVERESEPPPAFLTGSRS